MFGNTKPSRGWKKTRPKLMVKLLSTTETATSSPPVPPSPSLDLRLPHKSLPTLRTLRMILLLACPMQSQYTRMTIRSPSKPRQTSSASRRRSARRALANLATVPMLVITLQNIFRITCQCQMPAVKISPSATRSFICLLLTGARARSYPSIRERWFSLVPPRPTSFSHRPCSWVVSKQTKHPSRVSISPTGMCLAALPLSNRPATTSSHRPQSTLLHDATDGQLHCPSPPRDLAAQAAPRRQCALAR